MTSATPAFDLALSFPQWQGSARHDNLARGGAATAAICGRYAPLATVPLSTCEGDAHGVKRWDALYAQLQSAQSILRESAPDRVLTAGGDCSVDVAVIDYLNGRYPNLLVIWVDSHLDTNTPATTPSGSFHGMPVSTIMGDAPGDMGQLLDHPLAPGRFRYVHAHVGDEGEWDFSDRNGLRWLGADEALDGPVHIHFDLDALDRQQFPYLSIPEDDGMKIDDAVALVRRIAGQANLVGLTITEFSPADDEQAMIGAKVIARLCDAASQSMEAPQ